VNTNIELQQPVPNERSSNEMDSNANTCCAGSNFVVLSLTRRTTDVFPYDSSYQPLLNVPIVSAATAYDDPVSGRTFILILHECLYYGTKLDHSLINPNQLRSGGTPVWDNPFDINHDLSIECENDLDIPLKMNGTKALFASRSPTPEELNDCEHVHLTSSREWNPGEVNLQLQSIRTGNTADLKVQRYISNVSTSAALGEKFAYNDTSTDESILHSIEPSLVSLAARHSKTSFDRHSKVNAHNLSQLWGIGINRAKATMKCTTQRGVRSALLPLSRRYRAN
jgi:hypothetical protein